MGSATQEKPQALVEIERLGFKYHEVAQYDLGRLATSRRVQVRESGHYAPNDEVARYAVQMQHSQFPPIVVTADDWIVDGNTRIGASLKRDLKFFPALVLDVRWESAGAQRKNELHALAATLNMLNGRALTRKEQREVADKFLALGWKPDEIGRALGLRRQDITGIKKEIDAATRLARVGVTNGAMAGAPLRALGSFPVLALNDGPYKELAALAHDAGLNAGEISSLAKEVKEAGSDAASLEKLGELRQEMVDRIRQKKLTGNGEPPKSRTLRMHLGFISRFRGEEQALVETNPEVVPKHVAAITDAIEVLQAVLKVQAA